MKNKILRSFYCFAMMLLSVGVLCFAGANKTSKIVSENSEAIVSAEADKNVGENEENAETTYDHILNMNEESWFKEIEDKRVSDPDSVVKAELASVKINGVDFYQITSATDLATVAYQIVTNSNSAARTRNYVLTANIDLSGKLWTAIGTPTYPYTGEFYGNGYYIDGITTIDISSPLSGGKYYAGLFGYTNGAKLVDITVTSYQHSSTHADYCGALLAYGTNTQIIGCQDARSNIASTSCKTVGYLSTSGVYNKSSSTVTVQNPAGLNSGRAVALNAGEGKFYKRKGKETTLTNATEINSKSFYALFNGTTAVTSVTSSFVANTGLPGLRTESSTSHFMLREGYQGSWESVSSSTYSLNVTWTAKTIPTTVDYGYGSTDNDGEGKRIEVYQLPYDALLKGSTAIGIINPLRIGYDFAGFFAGTSNANRLDGDDAAIKYVGDALVDGGSSSEYTIYAQHTVSSSLHTFTLKPVALEGESFTVGKALEEIGTLTNAGWENDDGFIHGTAKNHTPDTNVSFSFTLKWGYTLNTVAIRTAGQTGASANTPYNPVGYMANTNSEGGVRKGVLYAATGSSYPSANPPANHNDPYNKVGVSITNTGREYTVTISNMVAQAEFDVVISREEFAIRLDNVEGNLELSGHETAFTGVSGTSIITPDNQTRVTGTLYTRLGEDFILKTTAKSNFYYMMNPTVVGVADKHYSVSGEGDMMNLLYADSVTFTTKYDNAYVGIQFDNENEAEGRYINFHASTLTVNANILAPEYSTTINGGTLLSMGVLNGSDWSSTTNANTYTASLGNQTITVGNEEFTRFGFKVKYDIGNPYYTFDSIVLNRYEQIDGESVLVLDYAIDAATGEIIIYNSKGQIPPFELDGTYDIKFNIKPIEYTVNVDFYIDDVKLVPGEGETLEKYFDISSSVAGQTNKLLNDNGQVVIGGRGQGVYALSDNYIRASLTDLGKRFLVYADTTAHTSEKGGISNAKVENGVYDATFKVGATKDAQTIEVRFSSKQVVFKFTEDTSTPAGATVGVNPLGSAIMPTIGGNATSSVTGGLNVANGTFELKGSDIDGVNIVSGYFFLNWYIKDGSVIVNPEGSSKYSIQGALTNNDVLSAVGDNGTTSLTISLVAALQAKTISITLDGTGDDNNLVARKVGSEYVYDETSLTQAYTFTQDLHLAEADRKTIDFTQNDFYKVASLWTGWTTEVVNIADKSTNTRFTADELAIIWAEGEAKTYGADPTPYYIDKEDNGSIIFKPVFEARELTVGVISATDGESAGERIGGLTVKIGSTITLTANQNVNAGTFSSTVNNDSKVDATILDGYHAVAFNLIGATTETRNADQEGENENVKLATYTFEESTIKTLLNEEDWFITSKEGDELTIRAKVAPNIYNVSIEAINLNRDGGELYPETLTWNNETGEAQTGHTYAFNIRYQANLGEYLNSIQFNMEREGYDLVSLIDASTTNNPATFATRAGSTWDVNNSIFNVSKNVVLKAVWKVKEEGKFIQLGLQQFTPFYNGNQQTVATASITTKDGGVALNSTLANGEQVIRQAWNKNGSSLNVLSGTNVNEFENEDGSYKTYTYTIQVRDMLSNDSSNYYEISVSTTTAKVQASHVQMTKPDIRSYYSGTDTFYGVKNETEDFTTLGNLVYNETGLTSEVVGVTNKTITIVDSNKKFIADNTNKYTAKYEISIPDDIASNLIGLNKVSNGLYTIEATEAITIVATPLTATAYGNGLYIADGVKQYPLYRVEDATEYSIYNTAIFNFDGQLITSSGAIGTYDYSTGITWNKMPTIMKGEDDVTSNFTISLAGSFEIENPNEENAYKFNFSARDIQAVEGALNATVNSNAQITVSHIAVKIKDGAAFDDIAIDGTLYTYYKNGVAILTIYGNGTNNLVVVARKHAEIDGVESDLEISLTISASEGQGDYKFNGFYSRFDITDFPSVNNENVQAVLNGVQAGTADDVTTTATYTSTFDGVLVYSNVKPIELGLYGSDSEMVYVSVGSPLTYANPSQAGFDFAGWAGELTGVNATVNGKNTVISVSADASLTKEKLTSTWTIAEPEVEVVNTFARDADPEGFTLNREDVITAIKNESTDLNYSYSWFKKDGTLLASKSNSFKFDGTLACDGDYYILITVSRSGYTDVTKQVPFTIQMSPITLSMTEEDKAIVYNNTNLALQIMVDVINTRVNGSDTTSTIAVGNYLTTTTKSFFFTIKKGDTTVTEIKEAGDYTITLDYDSNYFVGTKTSFNVKVNPYAYEVKNSDISLSKPYGDPDPALIATLVLNNENVEVEFTRVQGNDVGYYDLATVNCANKNYAITLAKGEDRPQFEITRAESTLVIEIVDEKVLTKVYNAENTAISVAPVKAEGSENIIGWRLAVNTGTTTVYSNLNLSVRNSAGEVSTLTGEAIANAFTGITFSVVDGGLNVKADGHAVEINIANTANYTSAKFSTEATKVYVTPFVYEVSKTDVATLTKVYGDADPELKIEKTIAETGETLTLTFERAAGIDVGEYALTLTNAEAYTNYTLSVASDAVFTITKAQKLSVEIADTSILTKVYNTKNTTVEIQPVITDGKVSGWKLVVLDGETTKESALTFAGLSVEAIENALRGVTISITDEDVNVASYNLAITIADGNFESVEFATTYNYTITKRTFVVEQKLLDNARNHVWKYYGQADPELSATVTTDLDETITITFDRTAGEGIGWYDLTVKNADANPNYNIVLSTEEGKVPRFEIREVEDRLTIEISEADIAKFTKVYNTEKTTITAVLEDGVWYLVVSDTTNGQIVKAEMTLRLVNTDNVENVLASMDGVFKNIDFSLPENNENVGEYPIAVTSSEGANYKNVAFKTVPTFTVTKLAYTITSADVASLNKVYGLADTGAFDITVSPVAGHPETIYLTRASGEDVGSYELTLTTGHEYKNYDLTIASDAKFVINALSDTLKITIDNPSVFTKAYNGFETKLVLEKVTTEGVVSYRLVAKNSNETTIANSNLTLELTDGTISDAIIENALRGVSFTLNASSANVGDYTIDLSVDDSEKNISNFELQGTNKFVITRFNHTITLAELQEKNMFKFFGQEDPTLEISYNLVREEDVTVKFSKATGEEIGWYDLTITNNAENPNYNFTLAENAKFEIKKSTGILRIILSDDGAEAFKQETKNKSYNGKNIGIDFEFNSTTNKWEMFAFDVEADGSKGAELARSAFNIFVRNANETEGTPLTSGYAFEHIDEEFSLYFTRKETKNADAYRIMREVTGTTYSAVEFGEWRYVTIGKAEIEVKSVSKKFNRDVNFSSTTDTVLFAGYVAGEEADNAIVVSGVFDDANVGTRNIVADSLKLTGANSSNYVVSAASVKTGTIEKSEAKVSISLDISGKTFVYGTFAHEMLDADILAEVGTPVVSIEGETINPIELGLISIAKVEFVDYTATGAGLIPVGTIKLRITLSSESYGNLPTGEENVFEVVITPMLLDFSDVKLDKEYDGNTLLPTNVDFGIEDLIKNGDIVTASATGAFTSEMPGATTTTDTKVVLSGADAGNYDIAENGHSSGTISQTTLSFKVNFNEEAIEVEDGKEISNKIADFTVSYPTEDYITEFEKFNKLPRRTGFTADGWFYKVNEEVDGVATEVTKYIRTSAEMQTTLLDAFKNGKTLEIFANWVINKVNITFESVDNIQTLDGKAVATVQVDYYSNINFAVVAKEGYKFADAELRTTGTAKLSVTSSGSKTGAFKLENVNANTTIKFVTQAINVTINISDGVHKYVGVEGLTNSWGENGRKVAYSTLITGSLASHLPTMTLTAGTYTFDHWTYGSDNRILASDATISSLFASEENDFILNFTANWEAVEYTIKFNANGGTFVDGTPSDLTVKFGQALFTNKEGVTELPKVNMDGKNQTWNSSDLGTGTTYIISTELQTIGRKVGEGYELTLYANFANAKSTLTIKVEGSVGVGNEFASILDGNTPVVDGFTKDLIYGEQTLVIDIRVNPGWDYKAVVTNGQFDLDTTTQGQITIANLASNSTLTISAVARTNNLTLTLNNATLDETSIKVTSKDGVETNGSVKDGVIQVKTSEKLKFTVNPNAGYIFDEESTVSIASSGTFTKTINANGTITIEWAGFTADSPITVSASAKTNTITLNDSSSVLSKVSFNEEEINVTGGSINFKTGTKVTIKVTLKYGYRDAQITLSDESITLVKESEDKNADTNLYYAVFTLEGFTADFNLTITASPREYGFTVVSSDNTMGSVAPTSVMVKYTQSATFTATANTASGYVFAYWAVNYGTENEIILSDDAVFNMVLDEKVRDALESGDGSKVTITGVFSLAEKDVTIAVGEYGSLTYKLGEGEEKTINAESQETFKARYDNVLVITLSPRKHYEVASIKYYDLAGNEISGNWYNAEEGVISFNVEHDTPSKVEISYKPSKAIVNVNARLNINGQFTFGSTLGGTIMLTDKDGNEYRDLIIDEEIQYVTYKVDTISDNILYFVARNNKGYSMVVSSPSEGVIIDHSYTTDGYDLYTVMGVYNNAQIYATFTANTNTINVQFVDENGNSISAGKIIVEETNTIVATGNYSSNTNIFAVTGATNQIKLTANVGLSHSFIIEGDNRPSVQSNLNIEVKEINKADKVSTGFNEFVEIIINEVNADGNIKIKVEPKRYNIVFVSDGREIAGSRIQNVTYGSELNIDENVRRAITLTKDKNVLLGYFTYEMGLGTQYIDRNMNATKVWTEEGYTWNGAQYIASDNYDEDTDTFRLYASWLFEKENFTIDFIPDALKGVKEDLSVVDVFANLDANTSWTNADDLLYASVQSGVELVIRPYNFEGYTFSHWLIERVDLDGKVENITERREEFTLTAINGDTLIKAVYFANFELAISKDGGGVAELIQNNVSLGAIGSFDTGLKFSIVAHANAGFTFLGWYDKEGNQVISADDTSFNLSTRSYSYNFAEPREIPLYLEARFEGDIVGAMFVTDGLGENARIDEIMLSDGTQITDFNKEFTTKVGQVITVTLTAEFGHGIDWEGNAKFTNLESRYDSYSKTTTYKFEYRIQAEDLEELGNTSNKYVVRLIPKATKNEVIYKFTLGVLNSERPNEASLAGTFSYNAPDGQVYPIKSGDSIPPVPYGTSISLNVTLNANYEISANSQLESVVLITGEGETGRHNITSSSSVVINPNGRNVNIVIDYNFLKEFEAGKNVEVLINFKRAYWTEVASESLKGTGSVENPYIIENVKDMAYVAKMVNDENSQEFANAHYVVTGDLDFSGRFWVPIGTRENPFNGTFDFGKIVVSNVEHDPDLTLTYKDPSTRFNGLFWVCGDNAKFIQANSNLILALSIVGGVLVLLLLILLILLLLRRKKKKRMEQLANG